MFHRSLAFRSALVLVSQLEPEFLSAPVSQTGLASVFRLAPGSQTVPAFRSELVSVFHLVLAPASHSEPDLPVSR